MKQTQLQSWNDLKSTVYKKRMKVFDAIKVMNGATLFEICSALGWPVNRVSGRVTELSSIGLIKDSGERRVNPTSGKKGIVWQTVARG